MSIPLHSTYKFLHIVLNVFVEIANEMRLQLKKLPPSIFSH
jgi:hypothetical protein